MDSSEATHHHRTEVLDAIRNIPGVRQETNEGTIRALLVHGFSFPLVTDPELLDQYPIGTFVYDKDYRLLDATEEDAISCEVLIHTRGPIHVLWLPDGASTPF